MLQAGGMGNRGDLFVLNMGEPVRVMDLAKDLIRLSGFAADQIPIVTTGIRTGEKLEEALWEEDATVEPTAHSDILRVREPQMPAGELRKAIQALEEAAIEGDRMRVETILCDWIPTFATSFTGLPSGSRMCRIVIRFVRCRARERGLVLHDSAVTDLPFNPS